MDFIDAEVANGPVFGNHLHDACQAAGISESTFKEARAILVKKKRLFITTDGHEVGNPHEVTRTRYHGTQPDPGDADF